MAGCLPFFLSKNTYSGWPSAQLKASFSAFPVAVGESEIREQKFFMGLMEKWFNKGKKHGMGLLYPLPVPPASWLEPGFEDWAPAALLGWGLPLRMEAQCCGWWSREHMVPGSLMNDAMELSYLLWTTHVSLLLYEESFRSLLFLSSLLPANALSDWHTLYHI